MKRITPYIFFNNKRGAEAINFYVNKCGMKKNMTLTYGDVPKSNLEGMGIANNKHTNHIFHAELSFNDELIYLADNLWSPDVKSDSVANAIVIIHVAVETAKDVDKYEKIFSEKGIVIVKAEDTSWNSRMAVVKDQFDVQWTFQYFKTPAKS